MQYRYIVMHFQSLSEPDWNAAIPSVGQVDITRSPCRQRWKEEEEMVNFNEGKKGDRVVYNFLKKLGIRHGKPIQIRSLEDMLEEHIHDFRRFKNSVMRQKDFLHKDMEVCDSCSLKFNKR